MRRLSLRFVESPFVIILLLEVGNTIRRIVFVASRLSRTTCLHWSAQSVSMTGHCKLTLWSQIMTKKTASQLLPKISSGRKLTAFAFCLCTALAAVFTLGTWNTRVFTQTLTHSEESTSSVRSVLPSPVPSTFKPCQCAENPKVPREMLVFIHIPKTGGENLENILGIRKDHTYGDDPRRPSRTCPPLLTVNNTAVVKYNHSSAFNVTSLRTRYTLQ